MRLSIMQPYLFPYIGYWQLLDATDTFVIYDDVNYIKNGYINRNTILINNAPHWLSVTLSKASPYKHINQINILPTPNKHLKTIELAYKRAPYFDFCYPLLKDIFLFDETNLAKFLGYSITKLASYLGVPTKIIYSSDIKKDNDLKGVDKVLDICRSLGARIYINSIGGCKLYNKLEFHEKGVNLNFIKSNIIPYRQYSDTFTPNLSIIDILMFNDIENITLMLKSYDLL